MLMKRIGKMRQKKGAVLFAVVAVMTLLIAMASTAYYTARSAYNSVVSNYDYSQLYMSAISVSDMVVEAMASEPAKSAAGVGKNNFAPLRDAVFGTDGTSETGLKTIGEKIVARSSQISESTANLSGTARDNAVLNELATSNSTVAGAVDGILVEIELTGKTINSDKSDMKITDADKDGTPEKVEEWSVFDYSYVYRTMAYYRNNNITVEDIVKFEKTFYKEHTPGSPEFNDIVEKIKANLIKTQEGQSNLNTFFTSTGHVKNSSNEVVYEGRTVTISTDEVTDDVYYQNEYTIFYSDSKKTNFPGGLTSFGSVILNDAQTSITEADNDWYIGQHFALTSANVAINLTDQNSLFIGGDLILANSQTLTAKDIYVMGNVYILGQPVIKGNLHVAKSIYYEIPDDHPVVQKAEEYKGVSSLLGKKYTEEGGWEVSGKLEVNGSHVLASTDDNGYQQIKIGAEGKEVAYQAGQMSSMVNISEYDEDAEANLVKTTTRVVDTATDRYESVESKDSMTAAEAITNKVGSGDADGKNDNRTKYDNYTTPDLEDETDAYDTTITVDFSKLKEEVDGKGNKTGYLIHEEYIKVKGVATTKKLVIKADASKNSKAIVSIPYIETGYILDIPKAGLDTLGNSIDITYNIDSGSDPKKSVPIILKDNVMVNENSSNPTTDGTGVRAFSWSKAADIKQTAHGLGVVAASATLNPGTLDYASQTGTAGNIVFEMANIDESGNCVPYDENAKQEVVRYVASNMSFVGTLAQQQVIANNSKYQPDASKAAGLLNADSTFKDGYDNQFMLVSNANDKVAYDGSEQNNMFCGIVYAPNGEFKNIPKNDDGSEGNNGGTNPILGGMIVSTYNAKLSPLIYAEPRPSRVNSMIGSLYSEDGTGKVNIKEVFETYYDETHIDGTESSNATSVENGPGAVLVGSNYVG